HAVWHGCADVHPGCTHVRTVEMDREIDPRIVAARCEIAHRRRCARVLRPTLTRAEGAETYPQGSGGWVAAMARNRVARGHAEVVWAGEVTLIKCRQEEDVAEPEDFPVAGWYDPNIQRIEFAREASSNTGIRNSDRSIGSREVHTAIL